MFINLFGSHFFPIHPEKTTQHGNGMWMSRLGNAIRSGIPRSEAMFKKTRFSKIQWFAPLKVKTFSEVVRLAHWVVTCSQRPRCLQIKKSRILLNHWKSWLSLLSNKLHLQVRELIFCQNSKICGTWNILGFEKKTSHLNTSESVCF